MENKILNLLKKIIKEDEDTFIDITDMDDDSAAETVISKKDIFKKLRDKMSIKIEHQVVLNTVKSFQAKWVKNLQVVNLKLMLHHLKVKLPLPILKS
jgi:hypothetical protein